MPALKCYLFGQFHMKYEEQVWYGPESSKANELLCYLLAHPATPHRRETLAGLLWGDYSGLQSKKCLRQALWQLQSGYVAFLGATSEPLITTTPEWVRINASAQLWEDITLFEQAYAALPRDAALTADIAAHLHQAVEVYQGEPFAGLDEDWCLFERERLQNMYLVMLDKLLVYSERQQAYDAALDYGARLLRHDPANERTHQHLMRIHYLAGDRTEALRQYERCVIALREELDVRPSGTTAALYGQLRADAVEPVSTTPGLNSLSPSVLAPTTLIDRLKQIYLMLTGLQMEVKQEIERLEQDNNNK
ncbi:MAG: bacterial transcriptional activator domain-containing protein [Blastocatellia bacterium]